MSSRFVALPVGQGDAFYLQRDEVKILVDGGRGKRSLANLLMTHVRPLRRPLRLDIVVCTHNDADHANGIIGLLEDQRIHVDEVWLPGTWSYRFADLVQKPLEFFEELFGELEQLIWDKELEQLRWDKLTLEDFYHQVEQVELQRLPRGKNEVIEEDASYWFVEKLEDAELLEVGDENTLWFLPWFYRRVYWWFDLSLHRFSSRLLIECINAAERIIKIVKAAVNAGCRIRLFEFNNAYNPSGGRLGILEPVNAIECFPRTNKNINVLRWLSLTQANRESLVFYAPERDGKVPPVLFTADSDLAFGLSKVRRPTMSPIVTAPHHGSDANAKAYKEVNAWLGTDLIPIWVRSDMRSRTRPGVEYKKQIHRLCTICNRAKAPKTAVKLDATSGKWQIKGNIGWCTCK